MKDKLVFNLRRNIIGGAYYVVEAKNRLIKGEIVIPATYDGHEVVIGKESFKGCKEITSLTIAEGIKVIEQNAFEECEKLTKVTLSSTVASIEEFAFAYCSSLKEISFCEGLLHIESYAFYCCDLLSEVELPNSLKSLGMGVFENCYNLSSIKIGDKLDNIGRDAFELTAYAKEEQNWEKYVLYLGKYIVSVNSEKLNGIKSLALRKGTLLICEEAFKYCTIVKLELPKSLKYICIGAFMSTNLNRLVINGTPVIKAKAFYSASISYLTLSATEIRYEAFGYAKIFELQLGNLGDIDEDAFNDATVTRFMLSSIEEYIKSFTKGIFTNTTSFITDTGYPATKLHFTQDIEVPIFENIKIETLLLEGNMSNGVFSGAEVKNLIFSPKINFGGDEVFHNASIEQVFIDGKPFSLPEVSNELLNELGSL